MDRHIISKLACFMLLSGMTFPCGANCPMADYFQKKNNSEKVEMALQICATGYNDDVSQYQLAQMYEDRKEFPSMLYFYQLAAESGHAEAQVRLSEILKEYDQTKEGREKLLDYRKKLVTNFMEGEKGFRGDFMHPYTLLLLASEPTSKKWYYPSKVRVAPTKTLTMLRNYKISDKQKQKAMTEASKWKTRKLLATAKEVVPADKYADLVGRLKNPTTQTLAMQELEKYTQDYIQNKHK